jgi:uncharacterized membrane protein
VISSSLRDYSVRRAPPIPVTPSDDVSIWTQGGAKPYGDSIMIRDETTPISTRQVYFDAALHPNRSLGTTGFYLVMGLATVFGFTIGIGFMLAGAWPVLGFCGVEILLLFFAFHVNYRNGRFSEHLRLSDDGLEVRRVGPKGEIGTWTF